MLSDHREDMRTKVDLSSCTADGHSVGKVRFYVLGGLVFAEMSGNVALLFPET